MPVGSARIGDADAGVTPLRPSPARSRRAPGALVPTCKLNGKSYAGCRGCGFERPEERAPRDPVTGGGGRAIVSLRLREDSLKKLVPLLGTLTIVGSVFTTACAGRAGLSSEQAGGNGGAGNAETGASAGANSDVGGSSSVGGDSNVGGMVGASCSPASVCGGNVSGTWAVTSSCLTVSGRLDLSPLGLGCRSAPIAGSYEVSGTITFANGRYSDNTSTHGTESFHLQPACLTVSGVNVKCAPLGSLRDVGEPAHPRGCGEVW